MTTDLAPLIERPDTALVHTLRPSPNHGERRGGVRADMLVLHYTGMPAGRGLSAAERAIRWLTLPASQVSCHYVVDEDGEVTQLVAEARRAWHAGVSSWAGETDINSRSIGIEIAHPGHPWDLTRAPDAAAGEPAPVHPGYLDFPAAQVEAVTQLAADIVARHAIVPERVLAHSDVAPGRKQDPGEKFPWRRLGAAGVGLWREPPPAGDDAGLTLGDEGPAVAGLRARLAAFGYGVEAGGCFDRRLSEVVVAFQRHWRPDRVDGRADASTLAALDGLIEAVGQGRAAA